MNAPARSTRELIATLSQIEDAVRLTPSHVVGPDVGTAASLFAAALYPNRFRSLTVGSGATAVPLQVGGSLKEWIEAPSIEPYRQIDGRKFVAAALGRLLERYIPSPAAREDYLSSYEGERYAESMRYVRSYPEQLPALSDLLPTRPPPRLSVITRMQGRRGCSGCRLAVRSAAPGIRRWPHGRPE